MDRFKFRVWSVEEQSYNHKFPFNSVGAFYIAENGHLFSDFGNIVAPEMHQDQFVVEQCTGLKDKNGNLIYEGDILTDGKDEGHVFWKEDVGAWGITAFLFKYKPNELEIIGNIHEQKDDK